MRRLAAFPLLLACLTAGCGSVGGQDRPGTDETLLLDSPPGAVHAGIYLAVDRGYDEAEGVQLTVRKPAGDAAKQLERGRADMAILAVDELARARSDGADLVGVMAVEQRPLPTALVLCVTRATLEDEKPGVRATIRALQRGYGEAQVDPESAVAAMASAEPGLRQDELAARLDAVAPAFTAGAAIYGQLRPALLRAWAGGSERPLDVERAFDTSLVGRSDR